MFVPRCVLLFSLFYNAVTVTDINCCSCSADEKEDEDCAEIKNCRWNCQNLTTVDTKEDFDKFYSQCHNETIIRLRYGHQLLVDSSYVNQTQVDTILGKDYLSICLKVIDPSCSLSFEFKETVEMTCAQDLCDLHYDRPTLMMIESANCSQKVAVNYAVGSDWTKQTLPLVVETAYPVLSKGLKPTFTTKGSAPNINQTNPDDYVILDTLKNEDTDSSRKIYGDVIITEDFPYDLQIIKGIEIYGCFKVKNATNAHGMHHFKNIILHDASLCHGERAIEFSDNESMCIPDEAFYSQLDNGAAHKAFMGTAMYPISLSRDKLYYRRSDCENTCGEYGASFTTSRFDIIKTMMGNGTCRYFEGNLKIDTDTVTGFEAIEEIYGSLMFTRPINIRQSFPMLRGIEDRRRQSYSHAALNWAIDTSKTNTTKLNSQREFSFQMTKFSFVNVNKERRLSVMWDSDRGGIENSQVATFGAMVSSSAGYIEYVDDKKEDRGKIGQLSDKDLAEFAKNMTTEYRKLFVQTIFDELWFKITIEIALAAVLFATVCVVSKFAIPIKVVYKMPVPPPRVNMETGCIAVFQKIVNRILIEQAADVVKNMRPYLLENKNKIDQWYLENQQEPNWDKKEEIMEVNRKNDEVTK